MTSRKDCPALARVDRRLRIACGRLFNSVVTTPFVAGKRKLKSVPFSGQTVPGMCGPGLSPPLSYLEGTPAKPRSVALVRQGRDCQWLWRRPYSGNDLLKP